MDEHGAIEARVREIGAPQVGTGKVDAEEIGMGKLGTFEVESREIEVHEVVMRVVDRLTGLGLEQGRGDVVCGEVGAVHGNGVVRAGRGANAERHSYREDA